MRKNDKKLKTVSLDSCAVRLDFVISLVFLGALCSVVLIQQCGGGKTETCNYIPLASPGSETYILPKTSCQKVEFGLNPENHAIQVSDLGEARGSYGLQLVGLQHCIISTS